MLNVQKVYISLELERKQRNISMGKSILMSIQPEWVAKILNGEKTIEIRKKFPAGYRGWVYVYCSKGDRNRALVKGWSYGYSHSGINEEYQGKVLFRFWCDNVEELYTDEDAWSYYTDTITEDYKVSKLACIGDCAIEKYLNGNIGYAIHITNVEIFPKSKDLTDYRKVGYEEALKEMKADMDEFEGYYDTSMYWKNFREEWQIKKPPQNYFYIEEAIYLI